MEGPESDQQRSKRQDLSEKALDEGEDPLDWLRPRRPQFPSLWRLARKYLCVLATSTEAERLFSWTGFMLNKRRLSLSGETMSMQLKDNIKLWSFNGALVFASKYNHRHAHAIALHMRKPLLCTCAPHCFAHARPIIPRTSTIRKHATRPPFPAPKTSGGQIYLQSTMRPDLLPLFYVFIVSIIFFCYFVLRQL